MKKLLILLFITASLFGTESKLRKHVEHNTFTKCIGGYLFVITYINARGSGIAIQQVVSKPKYRIEPPQPIICKG